MREPIPAHRVLLADADPLRRRFLADNLSADGLLVETASTVAETRRRVAGGPPSLVVLAPLQRPADAIALVRELRAEPRALPAQPAVPVMLLGPGDDELAELRALRAGADDWSGLPVRYPVLHARVLALLRRAREHAPLRRLRIGMLELSPAERRVRVAGRAVELANLEFTLLAHLASEPTRVFTKQQLLREIWGHDPGSRTRTLDSHACRLRSKLAAAGGGRWVENVWGVGYRLLSPIDEPERNGSAA